MKNTFTLFKKELCGYFLHPLGWITLAFTALMQGLSLSTTMKGFSDHPVAQTLVYYTFQTPNFWFYFLFLFPLITMRLFAEEEKAGTLETLFTAPVRTWQVVISKYTASLLFYLLLWVPAFVQFQMFTWITDLPPPFTTGSLWGSWFILFLMGTYFIAIGCLASALTSSQIIAAIICIGILVFHYFLGYITLIWGEDFNAADLFHHISSQEHLHNFSKALINTSTIVYYLSAALFTLLLTHHLVDYRRWKN